MSARSRPRFSLLGFVWSLIGLFAAGLIILAAVGFVKGETGLDVFDVALDAARVLWDAFSTLVRQGVEALSS